jgi:signal transduction histidine kinase
MTLLAWSGLSGAIACTVMAGLVYFANPTGRSNRLWAFLCLATSVWQGGLLLVGLTTDPQLALRFWRIAYAGLIAAVVLFYHFILAFTETPRTRTLAVAYVAGGLFLTMAATPLLIPQVRPVFGGALYYASPGAVYVPFVLGFVGLGGLGHVQLWRAWRRSRQRRQRALFGWFLAASAIVFTGSVSCLLPTFGIALYPAGNFAVTVFPLIMAYAFLRHRLTDPRAALARGLMFLASYLLSVGLPVLVGYLYQPTWQRLLGDWWWLVPVGLMALLASASPVVYLMASRRLEQSLWQAQRRYHRSLISASSGMTRIKDVQQLCRLIAYMVNRTVGLTNALVFLYEPREQRYVLRAARYRSLAPASLSIEQTAPLIQLLQEDKDLLVLAELEQERGGVREEEPRRAQAAQASAWMRGLEARLIVPSFSDSRLLAFLVLGAKRSGEPYTTDDIAVFSGLANQAALAIENAMVFEELRLNEAYMVQSEKLASLGQLASGMAHEIHNPLTIISGESQLYLERFKGNNPQVDAVLQSIIEECRRAADITRRILRFAKPAPPELSSVDLRAAVEESLNLAGYQVRLEKIQRVVDLPEQLPRVRGNQNQLQEVLLNLILNACQAMGEKGGRISLSARPNGSQVLLIVEDNGPGIPAAAQRKVFDPFYTTKSAGTGLGLFVTQRIVKAHGGDIRLESQEGRGTRFTITLPVWSGQAPDGSQVTGAAAPPARTG